MDSPSTKILLFSRVPGPRYKVVYDTRQVPFIIRYAEMVMMPDAFETRMVPYDAPPWSVAN